MTLTIGGAAHATGLSPKAIRLYEAHGLLGTLKRTQGGYRMYGEHDVAVLRFIRQARALGLELGEVRRILELQRGGGQPCTTVLELLDRRIGEIDDTIAQLQELRRSLLGARNSTRHRRKQGEQIVVCQLIESQPLAASSTHRRQRSVVAAATRLAASL